MSGSSHTQQQQTFQNGPWAPTSQPLADTIPQMQTLEQTQAGWKPYGTYTGNPVAQFNPAETQAFDIMTNTATGGTSAVPSANAMLTNTENGNFLSAGNPYFQGLESSVAQSVLPQLDSQWAKAGRFSGNEEAPQAIGKGLTAAMMPYAYSNYTTERENQLKGATQAAGLDQAQYIDPSTLFHAVGVPQQALEQQNIEASGIYPGLYAQSQPTNAFQNYIANLTGLGNMGRQGSSSTYGTQTPSTMQEIFGGGMAGAGIMGSLFGGGGGGSSGGSGGGGMMGMMPSFGSMMPWMFGAGAGAGGAADMAGGALGGALVAV